MSTIISKFLLSNFLNAFSSSLFVSRAKPITFCLFFGVSLTPETVKKYLALVDQVVILGGLVGDEFDNNKKNRKEELESAEIIKVETKTLTTVLSENNSPNNIDYLSLDVEGAEEFILKNFDFEKYTFRFITVERPSDTLNILLDKNGYIQIKSIESESFYTHKNYFKSVNLKPNINFKLTKRKDW